MKERLSGIYENIALIISLTTKRIRDKNLPNARLSLQSSRFLKVVSFFLSRRIKRDVNMLTFYVMSHMFTFYVMSHKMLTFMRLINHVNVILQLECIDMQPDIVACCI